MILLGSEKARYLRGVMESKSTEELQRILQTGSRYSKETILVVREILSKRRKLEKTEEPKTNTNFVNCPDCGKLVSKRAEQCPNCGASVKKIL